MKTELTKLDHLMVISAVAGLILAALAFLMPAAAEAAIPGPSNAAPAGATVPASPHGAIVQTGPRTFRADVCRRPLPPVGRTYVWIPGHFEEVRVVRDCRKYHRPDQRPHRRTKVDHFRKHRRSPKSQRHHHDRVVWVPGHWELV